MKKLFLFLLIFSLNSCINPELSDKKTLKEYFTGGKIRSEFIMDDNSDQNGVLKKYGYHGNLTSTVQIQHGIKNGREIGFDAKGRVLWHLNYVNGKQHGMQKAYYPNADLMLSYMYVNGLKHGVAKTYNKDGSIHKEVMYYQDKLQD